MNHKEQRMKKIILLLLIALLLFSCATVRESEPITEIKEIKTIDDAYAENMQMVAFLIGVGIASANWYVYHELTLLAR